MPKTETFDGYCMKCKRSREISGTYATTKNGRGALKGVCPKCGTSVHKFTKAR